LMNMSLKRTFGLVGDYGSSSEDEDGGVESAEKKVKIPSETEKDLHNDSVEVLDTNEASSEKQVVGSSKWEGVRQEYEDSSLMYKYIQDTEEAEEQTSKGKGEKKSVPETVDHEKKKIDPEKAAADALAAADAVIQSVAVNNVKTALDDPESKAKYYKAIYDEKLKEEQAKKAVEEAARDWEIREIQREIEEERKKWDAAWSDDEGEGAESEAVFKDQKRRETVLQAVIDEVKKANKKPVEEVKSFAKKGEGWKRLQIIAESRVKNDPEKYITYPSHKFPLRDQ